MPLMDRYRDYFDIDPEYFPAVNEAVIRNKPDMWKKFYPHETFVTLLKNTADVLERKQKLCLWVEGSYGTGKSHAVLTLKHLLDADAEDTQAYFTRYGMSTDLYKRFQAVKTSGGKILTVHRYGSASIHGDHSLVFAVQESIEQALREAGIQNQGGNALKDATIAWLSDPFNRSYFNDLITETYADLFGGDNVDQVLEKLNSYTGTSLSKVMDNIFKVAEERQIRAMTLSTNALTGWIREVIRANGLKAIVFIWDEFTEYFYNNSRNMTGFQELCELSETCPFYFILVTHVTQGLFYDNDPEFKKLNGRFVNPHCTIQLPENIAFQLLGAAMERNHDPQVEEDWTDIQNELTAVTSQSRKIVRSKMNKITEQEMIDILPIHPYAALMLKQISTSFDSNQRSMFSFIQDDRGDEIKGFQWFIDNCGPCDSNPLLTVDMLWDFFYEKGKEYLTHEIRAILDYYERAASQNLTSDQKRVLKTILLLQAISQESFDLVDLFIPNAANLKNAFEGSDLQDHAVRIAEQLVSDHVLFSKNVDGKKQYAAYSADPIVDLGPYLEQIDKKTTTELITEELNDRSRVTDAVSLRGAFKLRYVLKAVSGSDFDSAVRQLRNTEERYAGKIVAVVCFAKTDNESVLLGRKIAEAVRQLQNKDALPMIFIDASRTPFGADGYETYRNQMAYSMSQQGKDNALASQYAKDAKDALKKWRDRIAGGEFVVYTAEKPEGDRAVTMDALTDALAEIDRRCYPDCLECAYTVIETMYTSNSLKVGVECGCLQKTKGTYNSSTSATKLDNALKGAWEVEKYWKKNPYLLISKIKIHVDGLIAENFETSGRVSIQSIYESLKAKPYGFMPCNLTAFILGFVLKEYVADGTYSWSDGLTNDVLDVNKLKEMVDEVIHQELTPNPRYKDKYIVAVTPEEKAFHATASTAFGIPLNLCTSVSNTRELIRSKMKELSFPIWTLQSVLPSDGAEPEAELIDAFCGIANSNNMGEGGTDNDIAMTIGKISLAHPDAAQDLKRLLTKEQCTAGMLAYLQKFDDGILVSLSETVGDGGQYINAVRKKFDADAAKWVWSRETAQQKIREVILEYQIIAESNKVIAKTTSYDAAVQEWRNKCSYIRISYAAGKNYFDALGRFLEMLCGLAKSGTLLDSQKQKFLDLLKANAEEFLRFTNHQTEMFQRICSYYLDELSTEDIQEVYKMLPAGSFTEDKETYLHQVEDAVRTYKSSMKSAQLKKMWREKTHADTPRAWSKLHRMPIQCLIPAAEAIQARNAFSAVNRKNPEDAAVDRAMEYFKSASFFTLLDDESALEQAFRAGIIKNYAVILPDTEEVKKYLERRISEEPYDWFENPQVDKCLQEMAEAEYIHGGVDLALEKIDLMDDADVKRYLKELIKDNMVVGIEIIKEN